MKTLIKKVFSYTPHILFLILASISISNLRYSINFMKDIYIDSGLYSMYYFTICLSCMLFRGTFIFDFIKTFPKSCGNYALVLGLVHFINFIYLDAMGDLLFSAKEIIGKTFLLLGFLAFLFMVWISISSNFFLKSKIHSIAKYAIYIGLLFAGIHYFKSQKVPMLQEYTFLFISIFLLFVRSIFLIKDIVKKR